MAYEFSGENELVIKKFSQISFILGSALVVLGLLDTLVAVTDPDLSIVRAGQVTNGLLRSLLGLGLIYPAVHFRNVVTTEGNDIAEIVSGLKKQERGFTLMILIFGMVIVTQFIVLGGLLL